MGSVMDVIDCPHCGNPDAVVDYYYKTGEEYTICDKCGYTRQFTIVNREEIGKTDEEGFEILPKFDLKEVFGSGCYRLQYRGDVGYELGTFALAGSEAEFVKHVEENKQNIAHAEYHTFVNGQLSDKIILVQGEL
jgi:predicted nucleic-acid-binding Zn-ribbon protein